MLIGLTSYVAEFKIPTKFLAVVNQQPKPPTWAKNFFIFLLIKK